MQTEDQYLDTIRSALEEHISALGEQLKDWSVRWREIGARSVDAIRSAHISASSRAEMAIDDIAAQAQTILSEALKCIETERAQAVKIQTLVADTTSAQIAALKEQNTALVKALETEKVASEQGKATLVQQVSTLLGQFLDERSISLQEVAGIALSGSQTSEQEMEHLEKNHLELVLESDRLSEATGVTLKKRSSVTKRMRDGSLKVRVYRDLIRDAVLTGFPGACGGNIYD
jgi:hypothetical protein